MSNKQKRVHLSGWHYVVLGTSSIFLLASCGSILPRTITPSPSPATAASSSPSSPSSTTVTPSPSPTSTVSSNDPKKTSDVVTPPADVKLDDKTENPSVTAPSDRASTRVKQARARNFTGILNRASWAYFVENDRFTGDLDQLLKRFGSKPNSPNYDFSLALIDEKKAVQTIVVAKLEGLKSYTGLTYAIASQSQGSAPKSIVCESDRPTQDKPSAPELVNNEAKCPVGYTQLNSGRY